MWIYVGPVKQFAHRCPQVLILSLHCYKYWTKICPSIGLIVNPTNCWVIKVSLKLGNSIAQQKLLFAQQLGKLMCQLLGIITCSFVGWVENRLIVEHYVLPIKWGKLPNIIPTRFSTARAVCVIISHRTRLKITSMGDGYYVHGA